MPINIFLDSKAFDTIDHNMLLHKLKCYGLGGSIVLLVEHYLRNRRPYVEIYEMQSGILPVKIGVPQRSILGPLLFTIIYILLYILLISYKSVIYLTSLCVQMIHSPLHQCIDSIQYKNQKFRINDELGNVM